MRVRMRLRVIVRLRVLFTSPFDSHRRHLRLKWSESKIITVSSAVFTVLIDFIVVVII